MVRMRSTMVVLALLLAACGDSKPADQGGGGRGNGDGGVDGGQVCHPSGTALSIEAKSLTFFVDCLAAPAGQAFTLDFDNQDAGIPHNVAIYDGDAALFEGEVITGLKKASYEVEALDAGTYEFRCDVHPDQMKGAFIVE